MNRSTALLFVLALVAADVVVGIPNWLMRSQARLQNRARIRNARQADASFGQEQWIEQWVDHFNGQDTRMWKQRYFVNEQYWNGSGPIFVELGGEGGINAADVSGWEMSVYAKEYGALQFAVEHRYYGSSQPFSDLSTPHLQYLSSQQALEDAAHFITQMQTKYNAQKSPVVTFGGSYPGNLAAWFRYKYPHITIGSIASSAPVLAVADFYQYLDVVDLSLADFSGQACDFAIYTATQDIQEMLQDTNQKKKIEEMFNVCAPMKYDVDITTFMATLMGYFQGVVQYDNEGGSVTIQTLCDMMLNKSATPLQNYANVNQLFLGNTCLDASYVDQVLFLTNLTNTGGDGVGARQWTYQTCVEFGYFQTTDSTNQPFGDLVPLSYYTNMCSDVFNGLKFDPTRIDDTNNYYGATNPRGASYIVFANGSLDPWHALSIIEDFAPTVPAIFINGTAHCANMQPTDSDSPPDLVKAEQEIGDIIGQWLRHQH